jgi:hypothetical protein
MWSPEETMAVARVIHELGWRLEVEEFLGRCYSASVEEGPDGAEYVSPNMGAWLRVRYAGDQVISVTSIPWTAP